MKYFIGQQRYSARDALSVRSPHQNRPGTITGLLNLGWPPRDVAARVDATVKTIEHADPSERRRRLIDRMEDRRGPLVENIDNHISDID